MMSYTAWIGSVVPSARAHARTVDFHVPAHACAIVWSVGWLGECGWACGGVLAWAALIRGDDGEGRARAETGARGACRHVAQGRARWARDTREGGARTHARMKGRLSGSVRAGRARTPPPALTGQQQAQAVQKVQEKMPRLDRPEHAVGREAAEEAEHGDLGGGMGRGTWEGRGRDVGRGTWEAWDVWMRACTGVYMHACA
jgi:hypothetical protein